MQKQFIFFILMGFVLAVTSCASPKLKLFSDSSDPLKEFTLQGTTTEKVLVLSINGTISDSPKETILRTKPSMVQEIISQLRLAEKDKEIKALLLKINSPGGTITASDILYNEIMSYKKKTGVKVVAAMMDVAASGGYYVALPADTIVAHPTTITGSVGVIWMQPKVTGLMEKVGVGLDVNKFGKNKDMGSFFRDSTPEETKLFQDLTNRMGKRFIQLVNRHRKLGETSRATVATARVFMADEALSLGLVDKIGYLSDAVSEARKLAKLPKDVKVVVYRRATYANDNIYNDAATHFSGGKVSLMDLAMPDVAAALRPGFYYIWAPMAGGW